VTRYQPPGEDRVCGRHPENGLRPTWHWSPKMFASIPEKSAQAMQPLVLYIDNDYLIAKIQLNPFRN
jgi:hypothetical protein